MVYQFALWYFTITQRTALLVSLKDLNTFFTLQTLKDCMMKKATFIVCRAICTRQPR